MTYLDTKLLLDEQALPSGPPMVETIEWRFSTQAFQAAMPSGRVCYCAFSFLGASFGFGKSHPRLHSRAGFAAEKDGKVGIVRCHAISLRPVIAAEEVCGTSMLRRSRDPCRREGVVASHIQRAHRA